MERPPAARLPPRRRGKAVRRVLPIAAGFLSTVSALLVSAVLLDLYPKSLGNEPMELILSIW